MQGTEGTAWKQKDSKSHWKTFLKFQVKSTFQSFINVSVFSCNIKKRLCLRSRQKVVQWATYLCLPASSAADWWLTLPSLPHRRSSVMTYHKTHHHGLKLINRKRRADYTGFSVNLVFSVYSRPSGSAELVVPVWLSFQFWFSPVFLGLRGLHDTRKQNRDCFFFELQEK